MCKKLLNKIHKKFTDWLIYEPPSDQVMPYDFNRLKYELKPGDVILIEGRSQVAKIIRSITQSPWTHAALYLGRMVDFENEEILSRLKKHVDEQDNTRLIIEGLLDNGTVVTPLSFYKNHHIRICRPIGITPIDIQQVILYATKALGQPYNVRHLLDLTRFMLPWKILPRRWGSSLFRTSTGEPESGICSTLIAEAFSSVQFPILPFIKPHKEKGLEVFQRNPHLFTPKDFDYSPYFEIIKYPIFNPDEPLPYYRRLPWTKTNFLHQDEGILASPQETPKKRLPIFSAKKSISIADHQKTSSIDDEQPESTSSSQAEDAGHDEAKKTTSASSSPQSAPADKTSENKKNTHHTPDHETKE